MTILAGDIGGTKTLLQLAQANNGGFDVLYEQRYPSAHFADFLPAVQHFLNTAPASAKANITGACFGVAGPVSGRNAVTTNLPWKLDADQLERALGIQHVRLINDFQAVGYGIEALKETDLLTLQVGTPVPQGTRIVIGAGTGLGQGFLVWQNDHYEVVASEGGHASFAPTDALQIELLKYLHAQFEWPTWERVVSGRGLVNIFNFLAQTEPVSDALKNALSQGDQGAAISKFGLTGHDVTAVKALDLFIKIYGAQTGNFALTALANGGVYVAGGVAPKIIQKIQDGAFMQAFLDKYDKMQPLLKAMPVKVVLNEHVGLLGCAVAASRL
jgi:glucokinase